MSNSDMSQVLPVDEGVQAVAQCEVGRPGGWSLVILSMKRLKCPNTSMHPVLGFDVEAAIKKCEVALEQARMVRGGQIILPGCSPHQL